MVLNNISYIAYKSNITNPNYFGTFRPLNIFNREIRSADKFLYYFRNLGDNIFRFQFNNLFRPNSNKSFYNKNRAIKSYYYRDFKLNSNYNYVFRFGLNYNKSLYNNNRMVRIYKYRE